MKNALFILSVVFFAVGCGGNEPGFESHSDASPSIATSRDSEGGVSTRRVQVDITVGLETSGRGKGGKGGKGSGTGKPSDKSGTDPDLCPQPCVSQGSDPQGPGDMASSDSQVDILFYLGYKGDGKCWKWLSQSIEKAGFTGRINGLNWQMSTAFISNHPELYKLRSPERGGAGSYLHVGKKTTSILKRGTKDIDNGTIRSDKDIDSVLSETITAEYYRYTADDLDPQGTVGDPAGNPVFPYLHGAPTDPLGGLQRLLEKKPGFTREGSQVFIVFVDFDRYHYDIDSGNDISWRSFMEGHEHVNLIFVSSRRQSANLRDVVKAEEFGAKMIYCDSKQVPAAAALANDINSKSGMMAD